MTIGSGSSYKLEGESSLIGRDRNKSDLSKTPNAGIRTSQTPANYLDARQTGDSVLETSYSYESKYANHKKSPQNRQNEFSRHQKFNPYKSSLMETLNQRKESQNNENEERSFHKRELNTGANEDLRTATPTQYNLSKQTYEA